MERLLYRLSVSRQAPNFLLKGALLFMLWYDMPHRRPATPTCSGSAMWSRRRRRRSSIRSCSKTCRRPACGPAPSTRLSLRSSRRCARLAWRTCFVLMSRTCCEFDQGRIRAAHSSAGPLPSVPSTCRARITFPRMSTARRRINSAPCSNPLLSRPNRNSEVEVTTTQSGKRVRKFVFRTALSSKRRIAPKSLSPNAFPSTSAAACSPLFLVLVAGFTDFNTVNSSKISVDATLKA